MGRHHDGPNSGAGEVAPPRLGHESSTGGRRTCQDDAGRSARMLFNSLPFLFFFLPITYFVFWRLRARTPRYVWLTVSGYAFYSFWDYRFCALMALSTLISYTAGLAMLRWPTGLPRRLALWIPIVLDLSL